MNRPARPADFKFLAAGAIFLMAALVPPSPAGAQAIRLASGDSNKPIEVFADDGIEWQQDNEVLVARGNARAKRNDVTIFADVLRAYYTKNTGGGTDITRLDAEGRVKIASPGQTVTGEGAVYDMGRAILVVTGKKVRFTSGKDVLTANRQMDYWEKEQMAVARGGATAVRENRTLRADILVARFRQNRRGETEVYQIEAFDNVFVITGQDRARADKGIYVVDSGIATLVGNVQITRGENQMAGDRAEIDLNTGVSKLLTENGGKSGSRRVRGLLVPRK